MEFITVECMNPNAHEAHTWREGFLWHRKRECGGVPTHRHRFRFVKVHSDQVIMVWRCSKNRCKESKAMMRETFMVQTLSHGWPWRIK
jgi:hypothetical protein